MDTKPTPYKWADLPEAQDTLPAVEEESVVEKTTSLFIVWYFIATFAIIFLAAFIAIFG